MKVLINQDDAAFLRHVLESIQRLFPFNREQRRKLNRLHDKLSASRALWGNVNMKTRELNLLQGIVARTMGTLGKEIEAITSFVPSTPEDGTDEAKQKREERLNQLNLYVEYAKSVQGKLSDTLEQNDGAPIYVSQSVHGAKECTGPIVAADADVLAPDEFEKAEVTDAAS